MFFFQKEVKILENIGLIALMPEGGFDASLGIINLSKMGSFY